MRIKNILAAFSRQKSEAPRKKLAETLQSRNDWTIEEWLHGQAENANNRAVLMFMAGFFGSHLGLPFEKIRPSDRFVEDLAFPETMWRDWDLDLGSEFKRTFGVDILKLPAVAQLTTVGQLVALLSSALP
jgi:hypothetical protein